MLQMLYLTTGRETKGYPRFCAFPIWRISNLEHFHPGDRMSPMKRTLIAVNILLLLAAASFAAVATGKWKGSFEVPGGPVLSLTFDLKVVDGALTGKVVGLPPKQEGLDIKEGKVEGDNLSFWIMTEYQGNPLKLLYTGKLADGQIKFTMGTEDGGWSTEILAKPE
jgi:hypothetical protein